MNNWKIGVKVGLNVEYGGARKGDVGVITAICKRDQGRYALVDVQLDSGVEITCYAWRLNQVRPLTRAQIRAQRWAKHGWSVRQIAAKIGVSKSAVHRAIQKKAAA